MKIIDKSNRVREYRGHRSSRKGERLRKKNKSNKRIFSIILKYLLLPVLIISLYLLLTYKTKYWDGKGKLTIVINNPEYAISVVTFDPVRYEVDKIEIPANTQVEVARGLGSWKIKSVWKLGEEEKLGGILLAETLTNRLKMPVYVWADAGAEGLAGKDYIKVLKAVLSPYKTNMGMGDRIKIALFNISIKNMERRNINLAQTSYLRQGDLNDGGKGYLVTGKYPSEFLSIFSDEDISQKSLKVAINNYSINYNVADDLGEVIEILGAKVVAIKNNEQRNFDCEVSGNELLVKKIVTLFGCSQVTGRGEVFDASINIGESFAKRF